MNLNINTNTLTSFTSGIYDVFQRSAQFVVLGSFVSIQILPAQALAYTDSIQPRAVLVFSNEDEVIDTPLSISRLHKEGSILGVTATAYSSTVAQTDGNPFITASGARVRDGIIATNFLPFGTTVLINGKQYVVEDRMNPRYNDSYHIDIWMQSTDEARTFGRKPLIVEIVQLPGQ